METRDQGEIIVADNGSTDGSQEIATADGGARRPVQRGATATRSWAASRPPAGDSSSWATPTTATTSAKSRGSWPKLRDGYDLVQGCRLPAGGGASCPARCRSCTAGSATRCSRRWCARWFRAPIHDVYCGLRGFTKELYDQLDLRCTGMEFATEMIIKASLYGRADRRGADHAPSRRPHGSHRRTSDVPRRLADAAVLPAVQPALAVPVPGLAPDPARAVGYALAMPGTADRSASPSTRTRCCSPAWPSCSATSRSCSRCSPRRSPSARGCCPRRPAPGAVPASVQPGTRAARRRRQPLRRSGWCSSARRSTVGAWPGFGDLDYPTRCGG